MGGSNPQTNDPSFVDYSTKPPAQIPLKDNQGNIMTDAAGNTRYAPKQNATPVNTGKSMPEDNTLHAMPKVGDVPNAYGRDASPATLSSEDAIEQALTKAERTV